MRKRTNVLLIGILFFSLRLDAGFFGIPDGDTAIQLQTWFENVKQTLHLDKLIREMRDLTQYALDTSRAANAAVRVVNNVGHIIRNPADFLQDKLREYDDVFPEAGRTYQEIMTLRQSIGEFNSDDGYDPFALQEALFYARQSGKNVYEIKSRLMDRDGVSSPHDKIAKSLREQKTQVDDLFDGLEKSVLLGSLTPQMAMVFQARAAVQQARSAALSASHDNEMARITKIQFNQAVDEKIQSERSLDRELSNLKALVPKDLSLKPWR
jgi:hypothetical protein